MNKDTTKATTNDMTLEDAYEITRLDALPPGLQHLAALHALDQFEAVPPYIGRYQRPPSGEEHVHA